jgi:hypothetical protein
MAITSRVPRLGINKCKLCLQAAAGAVPDDAGIGDKGQSGPASSAKSRTKSSSFQVKAPLFCRECEQRLSKNGENYVMPVVTQKDGRFPLLEILNAAAAPSRTPAQRGFSRMETPEESDSAGFFSYFAFRKRRQTGMSRSR